MANEQTSEQTPVETTEKKKFNTFGFLRENSKEDSGNFDALMQYAARNPPMAIIADAGLCGIISLLLYLLLKA